MQQRDVNVFPERVASIHVQVNDVLATGHTDLEGRESATERSQERRQDARANEAGIVHATVTVRDLYDTESTCQSVPPNQTACYRQCCRHLTYIEARGQEPEVVRCKDCLGERAVFRVREVLHCPCDELSIEHERERVNVPEQLVSSHGHHLNPTSACHVNAPPSYPDSSQQQQSPT